MTTEHNYSGDDTYPEAPQLSKDVAEDIDPTNGLDTLRSHVTSTSRVAYGALGASLLAMLPLALTLVLQPSGTIVVYGIMFTLAVLSTFTALSILMKILFVIRGGTLKADDFIALVIHMTTFTLSIMGTFLFMVEAINS
jgi:hypothetical protein